MNKNKGFTIIELLVAVSLIAIVAVMFINNLEGINRSTNQKNYDRMINKINAATEAYISGNKEIENDLKYGKGVYQIKVAELIENGYLNKDIIDPSTGKNIDRQKYIIIKYMCDGIYKISFSNDESLIEFIEATPITIDSLPGNIASVDFLNLNTINFRLLNYAGSVKTLTQTTGTLAKYRIKVVKRSFTTSTVAGVHEITYNFFDNDNDCRRFTRQVTFY